MIRVGSGHSNLRFEKNKFTNVMGEHARGINLFRGSSNLLVVDNNYVSSVGSFVSGRYVRNSVFENNVIDDVSEEGFYIADGSNVSFLNNRINDTGLSGIVLWTNTNAYIKGNVIENADLPPHSSSLTAGILGITGSSGIIENNTITGNYDGIVLCPFCDNNFNVIFSSGNVGSFVVRNNRIHSNKGRYDLFNHDGNSVLQVAYNWFGPGGPNASRLSGNVVYSPYFADESLSRLVFVKENLTSGSNVFQIDYDGRVVRNVSLDLSGNVSRAELIVAEPNSRPENVSGVSSSREVYGYIEITDDVDDSLVEGADVVFKVPKSWLNSNGVDEDDVVLLRHGGDGWDDLDTRVIDENSDEVIFSARTSGFSFFAIADAASSSSAGGGSSGGSGGGRGVTFAGFVKVRGKVATASGTVNEGVLSEYDLRGKGLSVRGVRMTLNGTQRVLLTVAELKRRDATEKPMGDVHHYFGTHLSRAVERSVERFTVTFAVNKSWLRATGFERDEIVLLAREGDGWRGLNAEPGAENPTEIEFSADVKGPSVFAVTGRKREAEKVIIPEKNETEVGENPPAPHNTDETRKKSFRILTNAFLAWFFSVLAGVFLLFLAAAAFRFLRRKYVRGKGD